MRGFLRGGRNLLLGGLGLDRGLLLELFDFFQQLLHLGAERVALALQLCVLFLCGVDIVVPDEFVQLLLDALILLHKAFDLLFGFLVGGNLVLEGVDVPLELLAGFELGHLRLLFDVQDHFLVLLHHAVLLRDPDGARLAGEGLLGRGLLLVFVDAGRILDLGVLFGLSNLGLLLGAVSGLLLLLDTFLRLLLGVVLGLLSSRLFLSVVLGSRLLLGALLGLLLGTFAALFARGLFDHLILRFVLSALPFGFLLGLGALPFDFLVLVDLGLNGELGGARLGDLVLEGQRAGGVDGLLQGLAELLVVVGLLLEVDHGLGQFLLGELAILVAALSGQLVFEGGELLFETLDLLVLAMGLLQLLFEVRGFLGFALGLLQLLLEGGDLLSLVFDLLQLAFQTLNPFSLAPGLLQLLFEGGGPLAFVLGLFQLGFEGLDLRLFAADLLPDLFDILFALVDHILEVLEVRNFLLAVSEGALELFGLLLFVGQFLLVVAGLLLNALPSGPLGIFELRLEGVHHLLPLFELVGQLVHLKLVFVQLILEFLDLVLALLLDALHALLRFAVHALELLLLALCALKFSGVLLLDALKFGGEFLFDAF